MFVDQSRRLTRVLCLTCMFIISFSVMRMPHLRRMKMSHHTYRQDFFRIPPGFVDLLIRSVQKEFLQLLTKINLRNVPAHLHTSFPELQPSCIIHLVRGMDIYLLHPLGMLIWGLYRNECFNVKWAHCLAACWTSLLLRSIRSSWALLFKLTSVTNSQKVIPFNNNHWRRLVIHIQPPCLAPSPAAPLFVIILFVPHPSEQFLYLPLAIAMLPFCNKRLCTIVNRLSLIDFNLVLITCWNKGFNVHNSVEESPKINVPLGRLLTLRNAE